TIHYTRPVGAAQRTGSDGPGNETLSFPRATTELPKEAVEIRPHPHGVELGALMLLARESKSHDVRGFLQSTFSRVSAQAAGEIAQLDVDSAGMKPGRKAGKAARAAKAAASEAAAAGPAIPDAPREEGVEKIKGHNYFIATVTRSPKVYRGNPFQVEVGLAYGGSWPPDKTIEFFRFANRVPLLFQRGACGITEAIVRTDWRNYLLSQPKGSLPVGPMALLVHIASVWVPFTSESKEAVAH